MSMEILKEDIKNKNIRNLYLFYGQEEYLKKYYVEALEKLILTEDMKVFNYIVMDGKVDIKKLSDNCETLPVFADMKMVVIKNSGLFKAKAKGGSEDKKKQQGDSFVTMLDNISTSTCLVFIEEEIDKRVKVIDVIKKKGLIVEFAFQKPAELTKWVIKAFRNSNKVIRPDTAARFVENCEPGMTDMLNEINKLVLYMGEHEEVTFENIEKVCTKSVKSRIFDLTDAISEKNAGKAYKLLDEMITLKEPLPRILFMIAKQFRNILEMKLMVMDGLKSDQAGAKMGLPPFIAGKLVKQASRFSVDELKKAIEECLKLDMAIKTGRMEDRTAAEVLIASL